jgi:hypothetical protein
MLADTLIALLLLLALLLAITVLLVRGGIRLLTGDDSGAWQVWAGIALLLIFFATANWWSAWLALGD